jgi:Domain of unknown function (DUF1906)
MAQVLDYSAGFPGAQTIRNAGYVGAVRYIGFPDRRKCTTAGELTDFTEHGIGMALVFEDNTTDWRGGYTQGAASGRRARDHANAIGFPSTRPIYMAVDQEVVSAGEFDTMVDYLHGASTSLGGHEFTGVYGEADVIDRARSAGAATWFWQTAAWSRGRRTTAHLFQHVGTVRVGGIGCDVNDVLAEDWGHHLGADLPLTDADIDKLIGRLWWGTTLRDEDGTGPSPSLNLALIMDEIIRNGRVAVAKIDALAGTLTESEANLIATMRAQPPDSNAAAGQVQDLAKLLVESLGPQRATQLAHHLSQTQT